MKQNTRIFAALLALTIPFGLAGCRAAAIAPPPGDPPADSDRYFTRSATPPSFADPLTSGLQVYADSPLLPAGPVWDDGLMAPASAVHRNGEYFLFYNGLHSIHLAAAVGYATSPDGVTWTKKSIQQPVLALSDIHRDPAPWTLSAGSVLVEKDTWVMYLAVSPLVHASFRGVILRATAPSPDGPWETNPKPVLEPGAEGEWDSFAIGLGDVIRTETDYRMYYIAGGGMGLATSPDGIAWTKFDDPATTEARFAHSDPVFAGFLESPTVQAVPGGWALVYRMADGLFYFTSADGIRWRAGTKNPFLSGFQLQPVISLTAPKLFIHGGKAFLFYEGGTGNYSRLYLATWGLEGPGE